MPSKKQARKAASSLILKEATVRRDAAQAQLALIEAESVERDLRMKQYVQGQAVEISAIPQQVQMIDWMAPEIRRNIGPAGTALGMMLSTDIHDRDRGDDHPYLTTERDNAEVRGLARFLCTFDITAGSIMGQLEDVVINTGMNHTVKAEQGFEDEVPIDLITAIQRTVNEFRRINGIGRKFEAEMFRRSRRDGDLFRRFYPRFHDGSTLMRIVEPDQISEPGYPPFTGAQFAEWYGVHCGDDTNWKYGIHKDNKDSTRVFGYCVRYSDTVWEYVPASQMLHDKENADLNIALGRSDFTPAWEWLLQCSTLLRNLAAGTSDRSSISYTVNYEAAGENEVRSMLAASGATAHDIATWGSHYVTILKNGGKKLHLPKGMQVEMPNFGSDGHEGFINVNKHMLRIIATRWRMTEGQVTGDDSNNNRASLEEAGSKFHRYGTVSQSQHGEYLAAGDWKAVDTACRAGHYAQWGITSVRQLVGAVTIEVTGKPIENRQTLDRAQTDEIDIRSGVKTVAECQQERGMVVRKKSDGSGVDKSLTTEQNAMLTGYIELATTQGVPVISVRAMAALGLPDVDPLRLDEVFRPLIEAEKAQQQQAQAAQQQQQALAAPGEFGGMNLMQQKRNRASILQVLNQFKTGAMTEAQARTMLATTGLAEPKIDALIADAQDGTLDQPDLLDAVESAVREIYRSDVVAEARGMIAIEMNPNHDPGGENGGQFTSSGGGSAGGKVTAWAKKKFGSDEKAKNFFTWFGDSKVVDEAGEPLVVYHGTTKKFESFDNDKAGSLDWGLYGQGHYFAASSSYAEQYAVSKGNIEGASVIPAYVSLKNPLEMHKLTPVQAKPWETLFKKNPKAGRAALEKAGYDGVISSHLIKNKKYAEIMVLHPHQIKSAIGNSGKFSPSSTKATESLAEGS